MRRSRGHETLDTNARIAPSCTRARGVHDTAERGGIGNAFPDRVSLGHAKPDSDELTDPVAFADRTPFLRSAQRAVGHRRVGTGRGHAPLPFIGPRRHVG